MTKPLMMSEKCSTTIALACMCPLALYHEDYKKPKENINQ